MSKTTFTKIVELNPGDVPMNETDFRKWLEINGNDDGNYIDNLKRYLVSLGFDKTTMIVPEHTAKHLRYIHGYYYDYKRNV